MLPLGVEKMKQCNKAPFTRGKCSFETCNDIPSCFIIPSGKKNSVFIGEIACAVTLLHVSCSFRRAVALPRVKKIVSHVAAHCAVG